LGKWRWMEMHLAELKMREIGGRSLLKKKNFYATVNLLPTNALAA